MLAEHLAGRGREVDELTGAALRALGPALGPTVRGGLSVPDDLAVDNRSLLTGLRTATADVGVVHDARQVDAVRPNTVQLRESTVEHEVVVIAAGAHSAALHPALTGRVFPVKGEILRLRAGAGTTAPPVRTVRALVESRSVYLVPRDDGELVLGATQYEAGFDTRPTARGVRDLLTDGERVAPGIAEYAVTEVTAGLRAGSRDGLPIVEWLEPGVLAATGHHRTGTHPARRGPVNALVNALVNGVRRELPADTTVTDLLTALDTPSTGTAVAVDGVVVPRTAHADTVLTDGAVVEVLTAVQGG